MARTVRELVETAIDSRLRDESCDVTSGPNIPEGERRTRRLRIAKAAFDAAEQLAKQDGCSVGEAVATAVLDAFAARRRRKMTRASRCVERVLEK